LDTYREWKKIEFPKEHCLWIWEQQDWEAEQEMDSKMKWGRMEEQLVEKGGRKKYVTERNGRSSWERQGIVAFSTCQWNEWMNEYACMKHVFKITKNKLNKQPNNLVVPKIRRLVFVFSTWRPAFHSSLHSFIVRSMETACVIGRIPQTIVTHLKNRKKVTKQWSNKVILCSDFLFFMNQYSSW